VRTDSAGCRKVAHPKQGPFRASYPSSHALKGTRSAEDDSPWPIERSRRPLLRREGRTDSGRLGSVIIDSADLALLGGAVLATVGGASSFHPHGTARSLRIVRPRWDQSTASDEAHSVGDAKHNAHRSGAANYGSEGWGFESSRAHQKPHVTQIDAPNTSFGSLP
jgi:hypothetical protein